MILFDRKCDLWYFLRFFRIDCFDNYVSRDGFYCLYERIVYDNIDNKRT